MSYQIESFDVEKIIPYARNPRKNDHAVDQVAAAIREFGFRVPMLVKSDGSLVDGHLRLKAAKKLGLETVPVVFCDDMTETQIKAFRLSVNRMAELADWDEELLKLELEELKFEDVDLDLIGFEDFEVEKEFLKDEDDVPEVDEISVVKRGDIWILGNHRLMCGDSTSAEDVALLMNGEKADMVFTDPPYELDANSVIKASTNTNSNHFVFICTFRQAAEIYNSNLKFRFDFVLNAHIPKSFMNQKQPYYVHQNGVYFSSVDETIFDCKNTIGVRSDKAYWSTIIDAPRNTNQSHGHAKNIKGVEEILSGFSAISVIDIFGGSGSTLIACEKTNRNCFMMELDESYCDVIIKRWQDFTGKKAHRQSDNKLFDEQQNK